MACKEEKNNYRWTIFGNPISSDGVKEAEYTPEKIEKVIKEFKARRDIRDKEFANPGPSEADLIEAIKRIHEIDITRPRYFDEPIHKTTVGEIKYFNLENKEAAEAIHTDQVAYMQLGAKKDYVIPKPPPWFLERYQEEFICFGFSIIALISVILLIFTDINPIALLIVIAFCGKFLREFLKSI